MVLVGLFVKMTKNRKFFAMKKLGFTRVDLDTDKTEELVKKIIKNKEKCSLISTECTKMYGILTNGLFRIFPKMYGILNGGILRVDCIIFETDHG